MEQRTHQGGQPPCHEGGGCAPLPRGPMVALLHLFLHPYTPSSSHKQQYPAQARVLAHFAAIFDLLAQSTSHKTALGDCSLVCVTPRIWLSQYVFQLLPFLALSYFIFLGWGFCLRVLLSLSCNSLFVMFSQSVSSACDPAIVSSNRNTKKYDPADY